MLDSPKLCKMSSRSMLNMHDNSTESVQIVMNHSQNSTVPYTTAVACSKDLVGFQQQLPTLLHGQPNVTYSISLHHHRSSLYRLYN